MIDAGKLASQVMALEVLHGLLCHTVTGALPEKICELMRMLTGARSIWILARTDIKKNTCELVYVLPIRREGLFTQEDLEILVRTPPHLILARDPGDLPEGSAARPVMERAGIESMIRFPLFVGGDTFGALILTDLMEKERIEEFISLIKPLIPAIAIAIQSAMAHDQLRRQAEELAVHLRDLESRLQERTTVLAATNHELRRFRMVFETAQFGAAISDLNGTLLTVNPRFASLHGYTVGDMVGRSILEIHSESQKPLISSLLDHLIATGRFPLTKVPHRHRDGHDFELFMSGSQLLDDAGVFCALVTTCFEPPDEDQP
ncbi:MAG: hypothetical protein CVU65_05375 [Deltaproteobacteria bacterium HGW-Deltaproteobacteria-22]|nr:MAG: hypothetical protein CVU65_05375 [Deltaproteobacteria bacterium HGW-Deltaproteobacteria-22]